MIEPRALAVLSIDPADPHIWSIEMAKEVIFDMPKGRYLLTTIADVLAALLDCSPEAITAMHDAMATLPSKNKFDRCRALRSGLLAMLDQFELDQGSAT